MERFRRRSLFPASVISRTCLEVYATALTGLKDACNSVCMPYSSETCFSSCTPVAVLGPLEVLFRLLLTCIESTSCALKWAFLSVDSICSLKALFQYKKACCPLLVVTATILFAPFLSLDLLVLGFCQMGF